MFYSPRIERTAEKITPVCNMIFTADLSAEIRKDLSKLTIRGLRSRLAPLLRLIRQIAEKEDVSAKAIAAHTLPFISNESKDVSTANFCKEIIAKGTFANNSKIMSIDKSKSSNMLIWKNNSPNSSFGVRPVVLLAQKECIESVKFIMTKFINPEASVIEQEGIQFPEGVFHVKIIRSMLDGKMSLLGHIRKEKCKGDEVASLDQDKLLDSLLSKEIP